MVCRAVILLAGLLVLTAGCRGIRTCVETPFPGLKAELNQANTNGGRLRLLIVHGMSSHTQGYSSNFVDNIGRQLKLGTPTRQEQTFTNPAGQVYSYLTRIDFTNALKKLRAYELTWSPATWSEKSNRFEFDTRLNKRRASLNRRIKADLLNDGFGDAVLYLNDQFRPRIQAAVTNAIYNVLADGFAPGDQFIIVTHSLGSKLTFDCLNLLAQQFARSDNSEAAALTNLAVRTTYLIMLANQVPLLSLGETNAPVESKEELKTSAVQQFLEFRQEGTQREAVENPPRASPVLQILAISDPNDLLSYPLRRGDLVADSIQEIQFGNIFICNAPALLGWVANPVIAHEGYFDNPKLVKLLLRGSRKPAKACIKP
jgi:hypothetical protein